jgi:hypothetical protein
MPSDRSWGVSTGSYSDYRMLCICPSKRDAQAVAAKMRADKHGWRRDARVEPLPVVTADVKKVDILMLTVTLWDDGSESEAGERVRSEWPFDALLDDAVPVSWRWVRAPCHNNRGGRLDVAGTDHVRVRKTFSEKRAQLVAEDAFRLQREKKGRITTGRGKR